MWSVGTPPRQDIHESFSVLCRTSYTPIPVGSESSVSHHGEEPPVFTPTVRDYTAKSRKSGFFSKILEVHILSNIMRLFSRNIGFGPCEEPGKENSKSLTPGRGLSGVRTP